MSDAGGRLELREVGGDGLTVHERIVRDMAAMYDPAAFRVTAWCLFCSKTGPVPPHDEQCVAWRALEVQSAGG